MARYNSYGALDDRMLEDLDVGFIGFNNRLRADQLAKGILSDSKNGRMDQNGEWQTRKGISNIIAPSSVGTNALNLPFTLDDSGTPPQLADTAINEIYGSCVFSDPNDSSESYIILAGNTKALAYKVSNPNTVYELLYPSSITISSKVEMIQAFNKLFIFRQGGNTAFFKDFSETNINTSPTLELVDSGTYTQPVTVAPSTVTITNGVAVAQLTAQTVGNFNIGNKIIIESIGNSSGFVVGEEFTLFDVDTNNNTISFYVQHGNETAQNVELERPVSVGLGFTHMPGPEYGVYHQRRLAVPYRYSTDASVNSFTDRKIFDEILLSDILDTNTYDQVYGQFRFNAGTADFNVGMHSFSDDKLIVFNRNSIHIVVGSGSLVNSAVQLLTDEVGLIARKSIVQVGNQVLFLSDNGVYGMNFIDLYNLRGNDVPLSESINEIFKDIDKDNAKNAVATYFDNKYYIALPTNKFEDGTANTEGINNILLIYNFLNKNWESVDNVGTSDLSGNPVTRFEFSNLLVAGEGSKRGVYVTNKDGGVHKLEQNDSGIDTIITDIGGVERNVRVNGSATTRMFTFNDIDRKKFNNFELHVQSNKTTDSDATIELTTENVDKTINLTPTGSIGNEYGPFDDQTITVGAAINGTSTLSFNSFSSVGNNGFTATNTDDGTLKQALFTYGTKEGDVIVANFDLNIVSGTPDIQVRTGSATGTPSAKSNDAVVSTSANHTVKLTCFGDGLYIKFLETEACQFTISNFKIVSHNVTRIPKNEDVSVRGRLGNTRSYGAKMTIKNTLGRPRIRSIKMCGSESYRSTSSVQ